MPYDVLDIMGAPQNAIIGGASLWVMQGKDKENLYRRRQILDFPGSRKNAAEWHQKPATCRYHRRLYERIASRVGR